MAKTSHQFFVLHDTSAKKSNTATFLLLLSEILFQVSLVRSLFITPVIGVSKESPVIRILQRLVYNEKPTNL